MTRTETEKGLKMIRRAYPLFYHGVNQQEFNEILVLWSEMLTDVDVTDFVSALKRIIATETKPPNIATVRKAVLELQRNDLSTNDAWDLVCNTIRRYGSYGQVEAMQQLPPTVGKVVRAMGYRKLCMSQDTMVDRAHFIKFYAAEVERDKENYLIPHEFRLEAERRRYELDAG